MVLYLNNNKKDGLEGLTSDYFIHAPVEFYEVLSMLFNTMLVHGFVPASMISGVMIPIPKGKGAKVLCLSDNYRAIALSSIASKLFELYIIEVERDKLFSSNLQFGYKAGLSTTMCTGAMCEVINYYVSNGSNVHMLMLDASKAFDRVRYCKLFRILMSRNLPAFLLRILLFMYINQMLCVNWKTCQSCSFSVCNGTKQGGVISPLFYIIYADGLLVRLSECGAGCYIGFQFAGAFGYADDLNLIAPTLRALRIMIKVCENYAEEFSILFNGTKSKLIDFVGLNNKLPIGRHELFEGKDYRLDVLVNGAPVVQVDSEVHLGHRISPAHQGADVKKGIRDFWVQYNCFIARYGRFPSTVQFRLFNAFCMSLYGSAIFDISKCNSLFTAHRKALRFMFRIPRTTHCDVINIIQKPTERILMDRFSKFSG